MGLLIVSAYLLGLGLIIVTGQDKNTDVTKIPKCCSLGKSLDPKKGCSKTNMTFKPEFSGKTPETVKIVVGKRCKYGRYRLEPSVDSVDEFHLLSNGSLLLPFRDEKELSTDEYCLESFLEPDGTVNVLPLLCFPTAPPDQYWNNFGIKLHTVGCLMSIPFLILTLVIYLLIDEWKTIHGKIFICYSSCLAIGYVFMSYVQFEEDILVYDTCIYVGFLIQFFFVANFSWLNVICFHAWRRVTRTDVIVKKYVTRKKTFFWYSVYGWGCPFFILAMSLIMDLTPTIPSSFTIKQNNGLDACWSQNDTAQLSHFYGPISILLLANVVFFLLTISYLHENYNNSPMTNMRDVAMQVLMNTRKKIFIECLLLFCTMGLNWILEVVSWVATSNEYLDGIPVMQIFIDIFNILHGIIVFLVLVVQDNRVRKLVLDKFCFSLHYHALKRHVV